MCGLLRPQQGYEEELISASINWRNVGQIRRSHNIYKVGHEERLLLDMDLAR
jgi:hypothetical protein